MNLNRALRGTALVALASLSSLVVPGSPAGAAELLRPVSGLASVSTNGLATGNGSSTSPALSTAGRMVAFTSNASNLVAGDTNGVADVFVRDTLASTTVRVSVSSSGAPGNGTSDQASISPDGRWVAFRSTATNLVAGDTNGVADVFVRDLRLKTTKRVSLRGSGAGSQVTGGGSSNPSISADGTKVAFLSDATNVVDWDLNAKPDVFVRDLTAGVTDIVSVTSTEFALTHGAASPAMSANGRYVVFDSQSNQVGLDTNGSTDVFLRDRVQGTTERVSVADDEVQGDADSQFGSVSDDGRYVAFQSYATELTGDTDHSGADVFRRDRQTSSTILISRSAVGAAGNATSGAPSISASGDEVAYGSSATNLVPGDTNGVDDVIVRDVSGATTTRVSTRTSGGQISGLSFLADISPDGTTTGFATLAADLHSPDANTTFDVFWRGAFEVGPFADSTGLIQRNAQDFTGFTLTVGQLVAVNDRILSGTLSPSSYIDGLVHGSYDDNKGPVLRLYWSFFHRIPDQGGFEYWVGQRASGAKLDTIASSFASSPEFKNTYGSLGSNAFVTLVYQNVLGRAPDQAGLAHWVGKMGSGLSRGGVMTAFSESSEGVRLMRAEVDAILLPLGMLDHLPTKPQHDAWTAYLEADAGRPTAELIRIFLTSPAYQEIVA